ncbi:hypothetical protein FRC07_010231 [Ceratobasidium sp. 392]|nr:hypothetical protein FRC07_010231 [Ceratobasidium sp. 392]
MVITVPDQRVVVIATLFILPEKANEFIPVFQEFLNGVHSEPGLNHFTVSANKDFTEYGIYEEYKDQAGFEEHKNSAHSEKFNKIAKDEKNPLFDPKRPPIVSQYSPFRPTGAVPFDQAK